MSQWQEVLALLRERGSRGVHTFELRARYIGNPSQRIAELEAQGHVISSAREKLNGDAVGARYVLVRDAAETAPAGLFDPAPAPPVRGVLEDYEDAA